MAKKEKAADAIQEMIQEESVRFVKNARDMIRDTLKYSTLSLLGIETSGNRYEIDHCNGRNSVLIDAFRGIAIEEAKNIASTYKPSKEDLVGFRNAFEKEYKSQLGNAIREKAREKAKIDAEEFYKSIKLDAAKFILENKQK